MGSHKEEVMKMEGKNENKNEERMPLDIRDNGETCQNRGPAHLVLDAFAHRGLDGHNRSLIWIGETAARIGARIDTAPQGGYSHRLEYFEIKFPGRDSGVLYRIMVGHSKRHAELLSKRIEELEVDEANAAAIMHAFDDLMSFDVEWYDPRRGEWRTICMRDVKDHHRSHWPGDAVVSVMLSLSDDLNSCLEMGMKTLRQAMREALVAYWFAGRTPEVTSFQQVAEFVGGLRELQEATEIDDFLELSDRVARSRILFDSQCCQDGGGP